MISPRLTRLLRAADLRAMQCALVATVPRGVEARATAVLVPSTSAAEELRRTIEHQLLDEADTACVMPDLLIRGGLYARLHERLPAAPPLLTDHEREVLLRLAVEDARAGGADPPFRLRPGLLSAMLSFYDELRRRGRTIDSFDRHVRERLEAGRETDRGAARLLAQTVFLATALAAFERRVADSGGIDEHALRALILSGDAPPAYRHIVVTVADQAADPRGLWPADFDLLARMPGVERLDVLATERVLASGWHGRLHDALPGVDEHRHESSDEYPVLLAPPRPPAGEPAAHFTARDREEEVMDAARWIKARARLAGNASVRLDRTAVVFGRPLPYLYLARQVFESAGVPYQALDTLPLAAEPFAAAIDLVFAAAVEEATRTAIVDLLSSPHWAFRDPAEPDRPLRRHEISALDGLLIEAKYLGGWDRLGQLASEPRARGEGAGRHQARWRQASRALAAAAAVGERLRAWQSATSASAQITAIVDFVRAHERLPGSDEPGRERHLRARGAVLGALAALSDAHERHDDRPVPIAELVATVRRWIERQTFAPRVGRDGVRLVEAPAAAYADLDAVRIVGLVEADWPERTAATIFYPATLLRDLGWPPESERLVAARARFQDLLLLPREQISVSTFTLEHDSLVVPSPFLEDVGASGLVVDRDAARPATRIFAHEALLRDPVAANALLEPSAAWLALRAARTMPHDPRYHGAVGARPPEVYAVSRIERYLECPFKYFAGHVLQLEEEREDESGLTPQERGALLHAAFEAFFQAWGEKGGGAVTAANIGDAVALFTEVAEDTLAGLPEADRALERTYLLGSAVSPGLAERAFAFEIDHGVGVIERLLEHQFDGTFVFEGPVGPRSVRVRGKADRIDLLVDGSLRLVDYKLGRAPKSGRALQLPVYGCCAAQLLAQQPGDARPVRHAGYVAFREKNAFVEVGGRTADLAAAMREGQHRFVQTVDRIEAGEFPVTPDEPWLCTRCGFALVCRKDYVGDE